MTDRSAALQIRGVSFAYDGTPAILRAIDLVVGAGEKIGVIGPNGAGKTTLFLTICGVLKPHAGEIQIEGERVVPGAFHPQVGLVFQYPDDQIFSPSVRDDIAFGPFNMGLEKEEVNRRVEDVMQRMGISELAERPPHHLSGGQKRSVAIAGVQAMQPRLVLYDEPSANLDIRSRRRLIRHLQDSDEATLISSHDLELVLEICPRVVLLDDGQVIADGPARELMADSRLMEAHGLERPHSLSRHHLDEQVRPDRAQ